MLKDRGFIGPSIVLVVLMLSIGVTSAWAGPTYYPNGIYVGEKGDATPDTTPGKDDVYIEGTLEVDGATVLDGAATLNGATTLAGATTVSGAATFTGGITYAATASIWVPATSMKLPTSNPATASETGSMGTLKFADSSADDFAWLTIEWPANCDVTAAASMKFVYLLDSDTTETQGQWNSTASMFADGTTIAAAATGLDAVYDLPQTAQKVNVTTGTTIGAALIGAGAVTNIVIYHDVDDPFGDDAHLIGVLVEYTKDTP